MALTIFDIIVGPVISDKAYKLNKRVNKLVLKVHPAANKPLIKEALQKLFNVKVESIGIIVRKGKVRKLRGGLTTTGTLSKKAVVTLKEGYSLDLLTQGGAPAVAADNATKQ
jgi:large subunit ribosomal protein L23